MKAFNVVLLSAGLASLAACHPNTGTTTSAGPGAGSAPGANTVATVNGTAITRGMYDFYIKNALQGKDPSTLTQQQKEEALDNLVRAELVVQQADKDGIIKDQQTQDLVELSRMNAIQQGFSEHFVKENKPTEDELKKEYEAQVAQLPHTEYHVEH